MTVINLMSNCEGISFELVGSLVFVSGVSDAMVKGNFSFALLADGISRKGVLDGMAIRAYKCGLLS